MKIILMVTVQCSYICVWYVVHNNRVFSGNASLNCCRTSTSTIGLHGDQIFVSTANITGLKIDIILDKTGIGLIQGLDPALIFGGEEGWWGKGRKREYRACSDDPSSIVACVKCLNLKVMSSSNFLYLVIEGEGE